MPIFPLWPSGTRCRPAQRVAEPLLVPALARHLFELVLSRAPLVWICGRRRLFQRTCSFVKVQREPSRAVWEAVSAV